MNLWLLILGCLTLMVTAMLRLMHPIEPSHSKFELLRRSKLGDARAELDLTRLNAFPVLKNLRRITSLVVFVALIGILVALFGWIWATVCTVAIAVVGGVTEKNNRLARALYLKIEPSLLKLAARPSLNMLPHDEAVIRSPSIGSMDELAEVVKQAPFLDARERSLVQAALALPHLHVTDVMRPRRDLHTIDKGEVLGPLVIDGLYKTGASIFLVVDETIDHVVGILPLDKLTGLELTASPNALNAMDDTLEFVDEMMPIGEAINRLRSGSIDLLVVRSAEDRTLGAVTLNDITDHVFG